MKAHRGLWTAAITYPDTAPAPEVPNWLGVELPATADPSGHERRATVEVQAQVSGIMPRAALIADFVPGGTVFSIKVGTRGPIETAAPTIFDSQLGHAFAAGIPDEFGAPILESATDFARTIKLPFGGFRVTGGGFDAVATNAYAFRFATKLAMWALIEQDPQTRNDQGLFEAQLERLAPK